MIRFNGFHKSSDYRGGLVTIGNFDGVHRGHQSMIQTLAKRSHERKVSAVVMTFDPHPIKILRPHQAPPSLSSIQYRGELLEAYGVDCLIVIPTDRALLNLTPAEFFKQIVCHELAAKGLVEGENFCFGRDRSGDISTLKSLCRDSGLTLEVVPSVSVENHLVSSSSIRCLISEGEMASAVELLGHPYRLSGTVTRGAGRGRTLGFPTANLENVETLLPADGVYAGFTQVVANSYPAAVNIGPNPTFGETERKIEVHLVDYEGELYGEQIDVNLLDRIRANARFSNVEKLKRQLAKDIATVRRLASRCEAS
jgi:riboflavin kinase/FMN adenylyltransferase